MAYSDVSDSEMVTKTVALAQTFTPEMYSYLISLLPNPTKLSELSSRMETNYPAVLRGDPDGEKAFHADRQVVNNEVNLLLGLVKLVAPKDPTVQEKLGLGKPHEKTSTAPTPLTVPQNFKVEYAPNGDLVGGVAKVAGAKSYQIWACDGDPTSDGNWRLVASSDKNKRIVIGGVNRSKLNLLKIRAIRGNTLGPWSNWIGLDPR